MEKLSTIKPNRFVISPAESNPENIGHFVPRKARDESEVQRRKNNKPGSLILEEQARGFQIIKDGLLLADTFTQLNEWADIAVPATLVAGQYHLDGPIMHRHVPLPMLAHHNPRLRPNVDALREKVLNQFDTVLTYADILLMAHRSGTRRRYQELAVRAGRTMTQAALTLAALPLSETTSDPESGLTNRAVQELVRDRSLEAVRHTGSIALEIGVMPSAAQLPDRLSPLSVELQRAATDTVDRIYQRAA